MSIIKINFVNLIKFKFRIFLLSKREFLKFAITIIILFLGIPSQSNAQFSQGGTKVFLGIDQSSANYSDEIYNTIVDDSGNVYTTGLISDSIGVHHISTIKFNKNGSKLWQAIYPEGKFFWIGGLNCDNLGNVIVSGYIPGITYDSTLTLKYDMNGNLLWAKTYAEIKGNCRSYSNIIDSLGNIYISGTYYFDIGNLGNPGNSNLLIKYSPNGQFQWVQRYPFPFSFNWMQSKIVSDKNMNIYLLGVHNTTSGSTKYILLKYSNLGQLKWASSISNYILLPGNSKNMFITTDGKSSIYLGLTSFSGPFYRKEYATVKMDTNGNQIWARLYSQNDNSPSDMICDDFSNVIVTGNGGTIKYDSSGNTLWSTTLQMNGVSCDPDLNVYLTGVDYYNDILIQKLNPNGGILWNRPFNGIGNGLDYGKKVVFDKEKLIISGNCMNEFSQSKNTILKYSTDGQLKWANTVSNYSDESNAVSLSKNGNVYIAGNSLKDSSARDIQIIKYNYNLIEQWNRSFNGSGNGDDIPIGLGNDNMENTYVTGESFGGLIRKKDIITIKYSSDGDINWIQSYNGESNKDDIASNIVIDTVTSSLYVSGCSYEQDSNSDYLLLKYDFNGNQVWKNHHDGTGSGNDKIISAKTDLLNNIIVTGTSFNSNNDNDILTIKYDQNGNMIWENTIDSGYNDIAASIAVDINNNVYVTGYSKNINDNYDFVIVKYASSGEQKWIRTYNGSGNGDDIPKSCLADLSGNVYVFGNSINSSFNSDYLIIKYDSTGKEEWITNYNGNANGDDFLKAAKIDNFGNIFTTGYSRNANQNFDFCTIIFDSTGLQRSVFTFNNTIDKDDYAVDISVKDYPTSYGYYQYAFITGSSYGRGSLSDIVTIRLNNYVTGINEISDIIPEEFSLSQNYPNPFNPNTIINYELGITNNVKLKVYDVLGNEVATLVNEKQNAGTYSVDFDGSGFASGVYFYKLEAGEFSETRRMVLLK